MKERLHLPSSELEIMLVIWGLGNKVSTSEIMQEVKDDKSVQLLQSYLKRLEDKGFVKVEKLGRLNYYIPLISLETYRDQETNGFVDVFYKNSPAKLVSYLIANNQISNSELEQIRKMLEKSED